MVLEWNSTVESLQNTSIAQLDVSVQSSGGSQQTVTFDYASPEPWSRHSLDLSALMVAPDAYTVRFSLRIAIDTYLATSAVVRVDDVSLWAKDYADGTYLSNSLDAGSPAAWTRISWSEVTDGQTEVTVATRVGSSPTFDASWTDWAFHTNSTGEAIGAPGARFLQFRVFLWTYNSSRTPQLLDLTIDFAKYAASGFAESTEFLPGPEFFRWGWFRASDVVPAATQVQYEISPDGVFWQSAGNPENVSWFLPAQIRVRAWLTATNTSLTPSITSASITYEYVGALARIAVFPSVWTGSADEQVQFLATGYDPWGHTVAVAPTWETDDPTGTVVDGLYLPGTAGVHEVRALGPNGTVVGSATVTVVPGAIVAVDLTPPAASAPAGTNVTLAATGLDGDGNPIPLTETTWSATAGEFLSRGSDAATLRLPGVPGTVTVTAREGSLEDSSDVTVTAAGTPAIQGTVPDQVQPEDSTWSLDLAPFADPAEVLEDLSWHLTGRDEALYSVWGEGIPGNHVLVFTGLRDAFGSDIVDLWLVDGTGARSSQALQLTLTPVDDAPRWEPLSDLPVKGGSPYTFDLAPYVVDVDTPPGALVLTTSDPAHVQVRGLNLTLTYPVEWIGQELYLRLTVADATASADTVMRVRITSNTPPHVRVPLPDVTDLVEDVPRDRAFPLSMREYFGDAEGDDLFFTYGEGNVGVSFWDDAGFVAANLTPAANWFGTERVTFRATDGDGAFAEYTIAVTVAAVNDAPRFRGLETQYFVRFDTPFPLDVSPYVEDVDDALEDVTMEAAPGEFSGVEGFRLTLLFPRHLLGPDPQYTRTVDVYLNDSEPGTVASLTVYVSSNAPPVLRGAPLPDVAFPEDGTSTPFRLRDYFVDPDDPGAALSFPEPPRGRPVTVTINSADSQVTFNARPNWFGEETVEFRIEDRVGAFAIATIRVRVWPVNDEPRWPVQIPDLDMTGGRVVILDLRDYADDVDLENPGEDLTFTATGSHAAVYGYLLVLDYPAGGSTERVTVTADDGQFAAPTTFQIVYLQPTIWAQLYLPWSALVAIVAAGAAILVWDLYFRFPHTLEDVFIIGREGRLLLHNTRRLRADRDEDILAGMLTAIMAFVRDSFREERDELEHFEFGRRHVLVEKGDASYVAAIYGGHPPRWARSDLRAFLRDVEKAFRGKFRAWSGDRDDLAGLKEVTEDFVRRRRYSGWTRLRLPGWFPRWGRAS